MTRAHRFRQDLASVFYRADEVVEHEVLVMTLVDVFGHSLSVLGKPQVSQTLPRWIPRGRAPRN